MSYQPFAQRVSADLFVKKIDSDWARHKLPVDLIDVPPRLLPDHDPELNYLLEASDNWQEKYPATLCFTHRHQHPSRL
ncbi:hypothetical protein AAVH_05236 [Aphelenchoides avenae]|nr:hypothetical protein AAVH_05236 [Aphelenchus avenae]